MWAIWCSSRAPTFAIYGKNTQESGSPNELKRIEVFSWTSQLLHEISSEDGTYVPVIISVNEKEVAWNWSHECEKSYQEPCSALVRNPVILAYPKWDQPVVLETDASGTGIGGVLGQNDGGDRLSPIAFFLIAPE